MRKLKLIFPVIFIAAFAVSISAFATSFPGQQKYGSQASVSLQRAEQLAKRAFSGKIISVELEKEDGGTGLRYSFDIRHGDTVHEVGVDARTGKVLENSIESAEDEDAD